VRSDSVVTFLDSVSVRKLFLGVPLLINGTPLHPLRNRSDTTLDEIFLQQIVAMSESSYDRQMLIGVNRQGWPRPTELTSSARVLEALTADQYAVSFMWLRDVAHDPRIRVVRVLWSD
jgi:DNA-binding transcriptional LysR family regulator